MYTLYSFGTPNGLKPTIMLEELKAPYKIELINISKNEQFQPEFLKISPNNKIPVLFDESKNFYLFESIAILMYLAEQSGQFMPQETKAKYHVLEWCLFQAAHIGPMFGQYGHFHKFAAEDVPYAKKRYADESARLMRVMEEQLNTHTYISGDDYTIADMAIWPWIYGFQVFYNAKLDKQHFPKLSDWYEKIAKRPAVIAALAAY